MVLAPFRDFLPLIAFDGDFNVAQHLFADLADRRAQGGDGGGGIPVKDAQKVLMPEILLRVQPAAGHQRIGDAGGGGASERRPYVVIIIFLQKRIFNDAENIPLVVLPRQMKMLQEAPATPEPGIYQTVPLLISPFPAALNLNRYIFRTE